MKVFFLAQAFSSLIPARNKKKNFRFLRFSAFVRKFKNSIGRNVNKATRIDIWVFTAKEIWVLRLQSLSLATTLLHITWISNLSCAVTEASQAAGEGEGFLSFPIGFVPTSWPWTLFIFHSFPPSTACQQQYLLSLFHFFKWETFAYDRRAFPRRTVSVTHWKMRNTKGWKEIYEICPPNTSPEYEIPQNTHAKLEIFWQFSSDKKYVYRVRGFWRIWNRIHVVY